MWQIHNLPNYHEKETTCAINFEKKYLVLDKLKHLVTLANRTFKNIGKLLNKMFVSGKHNLIA